MTYIELIQLLKNADSVEAIDNHRTEIEKLIPQVGRMFEFDQKNYSHQYGLWKHCLHTVLELERNIDDDMLYLAALLHDIGKPDCQTPGTREGDTNMHYYGHPERSAEIVQDEIIKTLEEQGVELSSEDKTRLIYYVRYHDDHVSLRMKHLRRHLKLVSLDTFKKLMMLQVADAKAHIMIPNIMKRIEICQKLSGEYADYLYMQILQGK